MSRPFEPIGGVATTQSVAVTGANQEVTLSNIAANRNGAVRLSVEGTQKVFVAFGGADAVVATSTPLFPNTVEVFSVPLGVTAINVIAAAAGSTLYITEGTGV